jgi:hypothetical protein
MATMRFFADNVMRDRAPPDPVYQLAALRTD